VRRPWLRKARLEAGAPRASASGPFADNAAGADGRVEEGRGGFFAPFELLSLPGFVDAEDPDFVLEAVAGSRRALGDGMPGGW